MRRISFYIPFYLCVSFAIGFSCSSCSVFKEIATDTAVDFITDPKTGTPILTREYDTEPYQINVGEMVKSRKALKKKKKKKMEMIENYDSLSRSN